MNYRYSFLALLLTLLTCIGASAKTTTVTLTEGAAYIEKYSTKDPEKVQDLKIGDNIVDVPGYTQYKVTPAEGYAIVSFKKNGTQEMGPTGGMGGGTLYGKQSSFLSNMSSNDLAATYVLTVKKIEDLPRNTFTITIDDPTNVSCSLYQSSTPITLVKGVNTVSYIPTFDETLKIQHNDWQQFYSITLNGQPQTTWSPVFVKLSENADIKINVNYPESEYTYTLAYDEEDNFWTDIKVNGKSVTPVNNTFKADAGATVELYNRNADDWYIKRIWTPDGMEYKGTYIGVDRYMLDPNYPITFAAKNDGEIRVKAHKIHDYNITLNITGLEYLTVVNGSYTDNVPLEGLKEGKNELKVNELSARITVFPKDDHYLAPVTYRYTPDGELLEAFYSRNPYYYTFVEGEVQDGIEIFIEGRKDVETFPITINVNNPQDVGVYSYYDTFGRYPAKPLEVTKEGENIVNFPVTQNVLYIRPANEACTISSVTYSDSDALVVKEAVYDALHTTYTIADPVEGMTVNIVADHMEFDHTCQVYVDNVAAVADGITIVSAAGRVHTLQTGYNTVGFNDSELEDGAMFSLTVKNNPPYFFAFRNNEKLEKTTDKTYATALAEGDVFKVYLSTEQPRYYNVTFKVEGPAELVDVTTDKILPVTDLTETLRLLPGTLVSFKVNDENAKDVVVTLGRDEVSPVDGVYSFTVTRAINVSLSSEKKDGDAIDTIEAGDAAASSMIFDLNGRRVYGQPAPGIYVRKTGNEVSKILVK